jgi:hypothetical protein
MQRVSLTNRTKFLELDPVRVVLFIFMCGIIPVIAVGASQSDPDAQADHLLIIIALQIKKDSIHFKYTDIALYFSIVPHRLSI